MPLIGAQGPGSQIAWRGNLDEFPDEFTLVEVVDIFAGTAATSIATPIRGINYKALVTAVGSGASVRVTPYQEETSDYGAPGDFLPGNDPNNPIIIRNNDKIEIEIQTESPFDIGRDAFNKTYPTDVAVGTRDAVSWFVRTAVLDEDPDLFDFTDLTNLEINTLTSSDVQTVTGIDNTIGVDVFIVGAGELSINSGPYTSTGKIFDGDTLQLRATTSNFYNTGVTVIAQMGVFQASWEVKTRLADTTIDAFTFTDVIDVEPGSENISNRITISGADENLNGNNPLPISITNGEYRIIRNGGVVQNFTSSSGFVNNGDEIDVRVFSSPDYSGANARTGALIPGQESTINALLTVSNQSDTYSVTNRPKPIDTIPNSFTFNDLSGQSIERQSTVTSNIITLSGMSGGGDEGQATITSASGVNAEFQVTRNGVIVKSWSNSSSWVRLGDEIQLRLKASPDSLGTVSATFTIAGTDTSANLNGIAGSTTDTWNVTSAQRFCNITAFSLKNVTKDTNPASTYNPGETATITFIATGFDFDCGMSCTTSDPNSTLRNLRTNAEGTSLSNIAIGDEIEVRMVVPYYDLTRSTTVILSSSYNTSSQATWVVGPAAPPLPTLILDAANRNVPFVFPDGGTATLLYGYNYVTQSSVTTNFDVTSVPINTLTSGVKNGSKIVQNLQTGTKTFSMTVSNSTGSVTAEVSVITGTPPNPTVTLCTTNTSTCSNTTAKAKGDNVTFYFKSTNAIRVESNDLDTGNQQNGSVTVNNLQIDNQTFTVTAIGAGVNPPVTSTTHTINLDPFINLTADRTNIFTGEQVTLTWVSSYASAVSSSSGAGFNVGSNQLNGNITLTPAKGTTTYGITVEDTDGITRSDTVKVTAVDDKKCDVFTLNPDTITNVNRNSTHNATPKWGNSTTLTGLSPGVTVTATAVNAVFSNGSTTKTVQNGTSGTSLRLTITAPSNFSQSINGELRIGSGSNTVSDICRVTVRSCTVENNTLSLDGCTINRRRGVGTGINDMLCRNFASGSGNISRSGNNQTKSRDFGSNSGWTVPAGATRMTGRVIGGGGGGGANRSQQGPSGGAGGGGGGGACRQTANCSAGQSYSINIGQGGAGNRGGGGPSGGPGNNGGTTRLQGPGMNIAGYGGGGGNESNGGGGGGYGGGPGGGGNRGNNRSGNNGGGGGGAGRVNGGACGNGGPNQNGQGSNTTGGCGGGNGYGGNGSWNNGWGNDGGRGSARIEWTINWPTPSKKSVIETIGKAFWDYAGRPPTGTEMTNYYNLFKNSPASYPNLSNLRSKINSDYSFVNYNLKDNCDNPYPNQF
jgi:hypothetical protein